jgi:hypothetical protein
VGTLEEAEAEAEAAQGAAEAETEAEAEKAAQAKGPLVRAPAPSHRRHNRRASSP